MYIRTMIALLTLSASAWPQEVEWEDLLPTVPAGVSERDLSQSGGPWPSSRPYLAGKAGVRPYLGKKAFNLGGRAPACRTPRLHRVPDSASQGARGMKRDPVCQICGWEPDVPDIDLDICPKCDMVVCSFCWDRHKAIPHEQLRLEGV